MQAPADAEGSYAPWSGHLPAAGKRCPTTTYRLQLGENFTFADAEAQIPYLQQLGITDLYLSPILTAAPGSTHGYDVVDHSRISEPMGGRTGLESLARAAHAAGMGIVVDIVPNHMAVPTPCWHNQQLWSVLREGAASPYADWFDVPVDEPIVMPVLGQRIGDVLAADELQLEEIEIPSHPQAGPQWVLRYHDHAFPVAPGTESLPLHVLLDRQHYRLAYWKVGDEELNYRRFFDVGTLAAVKVENPNVFAGTHALIQELIATEVIDGLRVDHPDGLADPRGYLQDLAALSGGVWTAAEKILAPSEDLPTDWDVAGTTGYDAAWRIDQLQIDPRGSTRLGALLTELTGDVVLDFPELVEAAKREVINTSLSAEVDHLTELLQELMNVDIRLRDHTLRDLRACLVELLVVADQYRVYVVPGQPLEPETVDTLRRDAELARPRLDEDQQSTLDLVVSLLLGEPVGSEGLSDSPQRAEVVVRFQQVCGAVTAKGVEDTAFYRWTHLTSLTEVGGNPQGYSISADEAHDWAQHTQQVWPYTMVTGTTHDTKRGEDVRARLSVLSAYADEWADTVHRCRAATARLRPAGIDGRSENLLWQTIWGTWAPSSSDPMTTERLCAYLIKASREQKIWTSWTASDAEAETAFRDFAMSVITHPEVYTEMKRFALLTEVAVKNTILVTKALAMTWLGVADIYQGSETTRTSLVDPDNRRPVNFTQLQAKLDTLQAGAAPENLDDEKLLLTARLAQLRRQRPETFVGERSGYQQVPLTTSHAFAYARTLDGEPDVVVVVSRFVRRMEQLGGWQNSAVILPEGSWRDICSDEVVPGGSHALKEVLSDNAVAVFQREFEQATA